ncbi:isocitrate/isopropylmalate dehydrogenase family protein [Blastopirellula sp. J2-11]|uniref:isocitrate/isopropylmalate dehydrogenase family protein n=1 Tax=Blastopirellula sp. J2-11 TaxID=2943192 RepID=UPI0021C6257B|nr:isocitrate/isopropylmalate dehydrogenase family protein [Blastopirellula sp. J2-11]UUO04556.1 isocitrate/isopropylmalate dehydrogenase family protein [Blastopirellula sp. J2-11]
MIESFGDVKAARAGLQRKYKIALLPGDGIGPEVMDATVQVIRRLSDALPYLRVEFEYHEAGAEHYRKSGEALPGAVLEACMRADTVLLSAIGLPDVRKADGTEVQPDMMMGLRRALDLFVAVRPVKLYAGVPTPLKSDANIDLVILRENLEGLFASFGGGCVVHDQVATDTIVITRNSTQRLADFAFQLASRRNGRPSDGRRVVTCVDKANVFRSFAFFRKILVETSDSYPEIGFSAQYVDAMALYLVQNPGAYDILVMENQFGDILSDLGAALVGGLGMAPSAEIGPKHALFQPSHGSAPHLAGQNIANPIATILSASMMFDWLGDRNNDPDAKQAAILIENAVIDVLREGIAKTPDIGGTSSTSDVAAAIADQIS